MRVLSQLLGLPPPARARAARRRAARSCARGERARATRIGYDGGMRPVPPRAAERRAREPASTGTAASIPLEAPVRITADPATNALIVSATPQDWETLARRHRRARRAPPAGVRRGDHPRGDGRRSRARSASSSRARPAPATRGGLGAGEPGALGSAARRPDVAARPAARGRQQQDGHACPNGDEVPAYTLLLTALQADTRRQRALGAEPRHDRQRGGRDRRRPERPVRRQPRHQRARTSRTSSPRSSATTSASRSA